MAILDGDQEADDRPAPREDLLDLCNSTDDLVNQAREHLFMGETEQALELLAEAGSHLVSEVSSEFPELIQEIEAE